MTALDAPRHFAYVVTEGVATPTVEYLVEPDAGGTRFTMSGYITEMGLVARLIQPFALAALRRETPRHLRFLRELLESG